MAAGHGDIDELVRLYYRRRTWAGTGLISLITLALCVLLDTLFFQDLAGWAETANIIPLFILLALAATAFLMWLLYTVRLRGRGREYKKEVKAHVSRHPVQDQPGGRQFRVVVSFAMLCCVFSTVPFLPQEVNSVSYLVGAEQQVTFRPVGHAQSCTPRAGCSTVTTGFLPGRAAEVTWPRDAPLGEDFPVRAPLWNWGAGHVLITSTVGAIGWLVLGLFLNGIALLCLFRGFPLHFRGSLKGRRRQANQEQSPETATPAGSYPEWLLRENRTRAVSRSRRKRGPMPRVGDGIAKKDDV